MQVRIQWAVVLALVFASFSAGQSPNAVVLPRNLLPGLNVINPNFALTSTNSPLFVNVSFPPNATQVGIVVNGAIPSSGGSSQNFNTPATVSGSVTESSTTNCNGPPAGWVVSPSGTLTSALSAKDGTVDFCNFAANTSDPLLLESFGFAIPSNATITGIVVDVFDRAGLASNHTDGTVRILKAGVASGSNKANGSFIGLAFADTLYGSSNDLWGNTLTPADVNNAGFGVELIPTSTNGSSSVQIDFVSMTVYYMITSPVLPGTTITYSALFLNPFLTQPLACIADQALTISRCPIPATGQAQIQLTSGASPAQLAIYLYVFVGNLFAGPLFLKPLPGDGIQYVSSSGNDLNDGLSWGTAKLTQTAACAALPGGNSGCTAGAGAIFVAPGFTGTLLNPLATNITVFSFADNSAYGLLVLNTTNNANQRDSFDVEQGLNPNAADSVINLAMSDELYTIAGNVQNFTGSLQGISTSFSHFGSGTVTIGEGGFFEALNSGPGTATTLVGASGACSNGGVNAGLFPQQVATNNGNATACLGVEGRASNSSSGTLTNAYGLFAASSTNTGGGSIGTVYGSFVDTQTVGGTNYAYYSNGTTNSSLGGPLTVRGGGYSGQLSLQTGNKTLATSDSWVNFNCTCTVTIPHADFGTRWDIMEVGAGTLTAQCDSGTINGAASINLGSNVGNSCTADGINCFCH